MIVNAWNPKSGFFNELTRAWEPPQRFLQNRPLEPDSKNNGWWAGYFLANQHSAYNNGTACYYILKTNDFLQRTGGTVKDNWLPAVLKVLETAVELQREDGNFGYAYCETEPRVDIWDGFAGCWFAAACAYAAKLSGVDRYRIEAERALDYYYSSFV